MRTFWVLAAALAVSASLAAQTPPPTQEQKPDPKAAPTVAGKWNMSVQTDQGPMANTLDLKLDGKKVTGTMESQMGTAALEGEFAEGKLTFSISFDGPNGSMQIAFAATLKPDGTLAGTLSGNQGAFELTWTAERVKDPR